jgi:hypothetical protein
MNDSSSGLREMAAMTASQRARAAAPRLSQQKFVVEDVLQQYLVIAVFDYEAEDDGELSLSKHDIIEVHLYFVVVVIIAIY